MSRRPEKTIEVSRGRQRAGTSYGTKTAEVSRGL